VDTLNQLEIDLAYYFSELLGIPFAKPKWIFVSLSHKCTYQCKICGVVKILKGYELESDYIKKTIDEAAKWSWDSTVLFTGGEPFLRQDIFSLFDYSVNKNLKTEVVSNGSLINDVLAEKIVSSGINNIAISLDGASENTHDFIRGKGAFNKAVKAIKMLVSAKRRRGNGPQISVWVTIINKNIKELLDFIPLVKEIGIDCLVYHPVIVTQEDMQNTSSNANFWPDKDDLFLLKEQIDKIVTYQSKYGLIAFLHDPYLWIKYFEGTLVKKEWRCNPFVFINIGPDGYVRSCGSAFANIKEGSLSECLNTSDAFAARKLMKMCRKPCLQTCWAYPDADSLSKIIDKFIASISTSKNKANLGKEALRILETYENKLIEYKNA